MLRNGETPDGSRASRGSSWSTGTLTATHEQLACFQGTEKGQASAVGAEGYGVPHQSQHPSLAGLASPGPRLSQSSSCCLQSPFAHKYEFIRRRQPPPQPPNFLQSATGWSQASLNIGLPRLSHLWSCPSSRVSRTSAVLCARTWALEATHQIAPSSSHRLSQASFMLLHKPDPPFRRQALWFTGRPSSSL